MRRRSAYTLIELLLVITILTLLLGLITGAVMKARGITARVERDNWYEHRKQGQTVKRSVPIRILFIGNSFTQANNLPGMLKALAAAGAARPELEVETELVGGARLKTHWDNGTALQKIRASQWDFVVMQEQSQTPLKRFGRDIYFYPYARRFAREIEANKAIPLFFMTWTRPDTRGIQAEWTESYVRITKELKAEVAPAGMAWERIRTTLPSVQLYTDKGGHPSQVGTYLVACTFYAVIYDRDPTGLPHSFSMPGGQVNIPAGVARAIQVAVWDAVKRVKKRIRPDYR